MPNCSSCGAPLPPDSLLCEYCTLKNDLNLKGVSTFSIVSDNANKICPHCDKPMDSIIIEQCKEITIERCPTCMGIFFDPDEIEYLIDKLVNNVYRINDKQLWELNQISNLNPEHSVHYIKCPVCRKLMNRVNFGIKSGVVIDKCKHGIWLDNGELRKILEWRKAGGQLYHEKVMNERAEREKEEAAQQKKHNYGDSFMTNDLSAPKHNLDSNLLHDIARVVYWLFK